MHEPVITDVLDALRQQLARLNDWERGFLHSLQAQSFPLRPRQRQVLVRIAEKYCDPLLAAELAGQKRLF